MLTASVESRAPYATALGGSRLVGEKWMRRIYIDEAGISVHEKVSVVAGIVIDADKQWREISDRLAALCDEYVPGEHRKGFVFHAKEIFSGGKIFDRHQYPVERRWELLEKLVKIPFELQIPVCFGYIRRHKAANDGTKSAIENARCDHIMAFMQCLIACDAVMDGLYEGEVASVIAENCEHMKKYLQFVPEMLRDPQSATQFVDDSLPIKHIIDDIHFANKNSSPLLQIADVSAFVMRRFLSNERHGDQWRAIFCGMISPSMIGFRQQSGRLVIKSHMMSSKAEWTDFSTDLPSLIKWTPAEDQKRSSWLTI